MDKSYSAAMPEAFKAALFIMMGLELHFLAPLWPSGWPKTYQMKYIYIYASAETTSIQRL